MNAKTEAFRKRVQANLRKTAWKVSSQASSGACADGDHDACNMKHLTDFHGCLCNKQSAHGVNLHPSFDPSEYQDMTGACADGDHDLCQREHLTDDSDYCYCNHASHGPYILGSRKTAAGAVKGIAIYPDKRVEEVTISGYKDGQAIVGGLIEPVDLKTGDTMYVNEEFIYAFGPDAFNSIASDVAGLGGRPDLMMRGIKGPVYIVGPLDDEGYDTDISDAGRNLVRRVSREARKTSTRKTAWTPDGSDITPAAGRVIDLQAQAEDALGLRGIRGIEDRMAIVGWIVDHLGDVSDITDADLAIVEDYNAHSAYMAVEVARGKTTLDAIRQRYSSHKTAIGLTNVGVDPETGNGTGLDPQGNRVQFRLSEEDRAKLRSIMLSDLSINFSGVDVDPSDIISTASRKTANKLEPGTPIEIAHMVSGGRWGFPEDCDSSYHDHNSVSGYVRRHYPGMQVTYTDDPDGTGKEFAVEDKPGVLYRLASRTASRKTAGTPIGFKVRYVDDDGKTVSTTVIASETWEVHQILSDAGIRPLDVTPDYSVDTYQQPNGIVGSRKTAGRTLSEIAWDIAKEWGPNVNYAARPYLDALKYLNTVDDMYGADSARSVIAYFLSNASSFRGEKAKALKEELKALLKTGTKTAGSCPHPMVNVSGGMNTCFLCGKDISCESCGEPRHRTPCENCGSSDGDAELHPIQGSKTAATFLSPDEIEHLRQAIEPLDTEDRRQRYLSGDFPRADAVKDLDKRYRWDLLWEAGLSQWVTDNIYGRGGYDSHLDTGLRQVVRSLASKTAVSPEWPDGIYRGHEGHVQWLMKQYALSREEAEVEAQGRYERVPEERERWASKIAAVPQTYQVIDKGLGSGELWGQDIHDTIDYLTFHWGGSRAYDLEGKVAIVPLHEVAEFEAAHPDAELGMYSNDPRGQRVSRIAASSFADDQVSVHDDTEPMWPWEITEEDATTGDDAADVAGVSTPGQSVADYPQPQVEGRLSLWAQRARDFLMGTETASEPIGLPVTPIRSMAGPGGRYPDHASAPQGYQDGYREGYGDATSLGRFNLVNQPRSNEGDYVEGYYDGYDAAMEIGVVPLARRRAVWEQNGLKTALNEQSGHAESDHDQVEVGDENDPDPMWPWEIGLVGDDEIEVEANQGWTSTEFLDRLDDYGDTTAYQDTVAALMSEGYPKEAAEEAAAQLLRDRFPRRDSGGEVMGARSDYEHWNEEADQVWWQEEGRWAGQEDPPDPDDYYDDDLDDDDHYGAKAQAFRARVQANLRNGR